MGPPFATKLTSHWAFEIGTREFARFAACVTKALRRHEHEHVRRATTDVLAFAAMALCLESRFAFRHVANLAAIAPAFEFHAALQTSSQVNASQRLRATAHRIRRDRPNSGALGSRVPSPSPCR